MSFKFYVLLGEAVFFTLCVKNADTYAVGERAIKMAPKIPKGFGYIKEES